jgi:hypothetical protein
LRFFESAELTQALRAEEDQLMFAVFRKFRSGVRRFRWLPAKWVAVGESDLR